MKAIFPFALFAAALLPQNVFGAIGCTLTNPADDLKYLYPEMTTYKEDLNEFPRTNGGSELFKGLQARLGADLDPIYETYETPYTVYSVYKGQQKIGIVHGVNVPGKGGVIQVFLATDPTSGAIKQMFFQRLESPAARALRDKSFRAQFTGLSLADFYKHDYYAATKTGGAADKIGALKLPAIDAAGKQDYEASIRGVRKNLILLDYFVYGKRFEAFFTRAQAAAKAKAR